MVSADKKLIKSICKLTKSYDDYVSFTPETQSLVLNPSIERHGFQAKRVFVKLPSYEIENSIKRIATMGYITCAYKEPDYVFTLLPRINHRFDYWRDEFSKKFLGGFVLGLISGIIVALISGLVIPYIKIRLGF